MKNPHSLLAYRCFLAAVLLACLLLAVAAIGYQAPFSYEPVGPRAYPLLLLALIAAGTAYLIARPGPAADVAEGEELDGHVLRKIGLCVALFVAFAAGYEPVGFPVASFVFAVLLCRLYGGSWRAGVVTGIGLSLGLYWLFDRVLDVPLPPGVLSSIGF